MKIFVLFLLCLVAYSSAEIQLPKKGFPLMVYSEILKLRNEIDHLKDSRDMVSVNINDYLDNTMKVIQLWIVKNGMDPLEVENVEKGFKVKVGFITVSGEFSLKQGWMQGLSTMQRGGEAKMNYEARFLNLRLPLALPMMHVSYDYKVKFMKIGPKGGVVGTIKNLQLLVDISIDMKTMEIILQNFRVIDGGKITIKFSGNPIADLLANVLTRLATSLLHEVALGVIQKQVRNLVEDSIDQINQSIQSGKYIYY